ncbi:hypothetical protein AKJ53_00190 [candidate division MSBL1 archaeon SCGC-AAA382F02]|uniref:Carbohydrate-binding module family 96 domain-containing protein n=1 Tax=candidate division MSBL1 archaeon SCGC-AAA382F02 TaxID=1698282 RepID=A0A133VJ31_9EURY|nr:hypothetical protein AKJ53_00190 [candidate division MSBL1 archaeon SCGC-AAA382F02]
MLLDTKTKNILIVAIISSVLVGTASGAQYFSVSNVLSDEINVVMDNSRKLMSLSYVPGEGLGGENKEIEAGKWNEFQISLKNDSPSVTNSWKNILIRTKLYNINPDNIEIEHKQDETWENVPVYDMRLIKKGETGAVADLGPADGWEIEPQKKKKLDLRVKIEKVFENLEVEFQAITSDSKLEIYIGKENSFESKVLLNPTLDTFVCQESPSTNHSNEEFLELSTGNNADSYVLLEFDADEIPSKVKKAELYIYQYWGSGFSELRDSGTTIQVFHIAKELRKRDLTWGKISSLNLENLLVEENILGNNVLYRFSMGEYLRNSEIENRLVILLRFSGTSFEEKRRIRFYSQEGKNSPYLIVSD